MKALLITDFHRGYNPNTAKIQDKAYGLLDSSLFDCIIVSGDWGTSKIDHVEGAFRYLRKMFPDKKIFGVLGNHDFWDKKMTVASKSQMIKKYAEKYNIHLLENNAANFMGYDIVGFNGWFHNYEYGRNELNYLSQYGGPGSKVVVEEFQAKEKIAIKYIEDLQLKNRDKTIIVSHFPCFKETFDGEYDNSDPANREFVAKNARFFIFGHTHEEVFQELDSTIIINVGAIYGKAKFKIYNFDTMTFELEFK